MRVAIKVVIFSVFLLVAVAACGVPAEERTYATTINQLLAQINSVTSVDTNQPEEVKESVSAALPKMEQLEATLKTEEAKLKGRAKEIAGDISQDATQTLTDLRKLQEAYASGDTKAIEREHAKFVASADRLEDGIQVWNSVVAGGVTSTR